MKTAKLIAAGIALAVAGGAAGAQDFTFSNELSSDIVEISIPKDGDTDVEFQGITNETSVEFKSSRVDFGITADVVFKKNTNNDSFHIGLDNAELNDWYIEFRPVRRVTLFLSDKIKTKGAYLPVDDSKMALSDLGSDLGVCLRPIDGLRITGGLDFTSYFGKNEADADLKPDLNFGVDYTYGSLCTAGVTFRNVIEDFAFGGFASYSGIDGLDVYAGFSYNDTAGKNDVKGKETGLLSLGAEYGLDALWLGFDFVTDFGKDDSGANKNFYTGLGAGYDVTDDLNVGVSVTFASTFKDLGDNYEVGINPAVTYTLGQHEFSAGVGVTLEKEQTTLAFPVAWTFSL